MNSAVIVLNKPHGPTSAACLNKIKKKFKIKKLGHAGTLDPMATGVLVVLAGQATKLADYIMDGRKTYYGELRLGLETDTYDIQGIVQQEYDYSHVQPDLIKKTVLEWESLLSQQVPPVSAAKHKGRPLHALQRAGQKVPVKFKDIKVFRAEIIKIDIPSIFFRVTCSAGTYIRSLAHSLGKRLECGAVLTKLIREKSHPFSLGQAVELDRLMEADSWQDYALSISQALAHWPRLKLDSNNARQVRHGHPIEASSFPEVKAQENEMALMVDSSGEPLALTALEHSRDGRWMWTVKRGLWTSH
ncbi:tRNA pseudouridine(55) synthase TruB [Desulfonatronovibrio magnus]|uniref:tRNA pseudouridine(55) synthase TruB n=1 Tax=Desulfonatronovibrio magnus TaxID=698827 RepID=UPI0005EADE4A|nr:tRNA pseudouridine(55) synthase TruB [Desulfonatronovibrio magnus]